MFKLFEDYNWDNAVSNFETSLKVMGLGMAGVFIVMAVLIASIVVLAKLTGKKKDDSED
ncbi:MAG: OadG family protein [Oscillospiraceae bacterium]